MPPSPLADYNTFCAWLLAMCGVDNNARAAAEDLFTTFRTDYPIECCGYLIEAMRSTSVDEAPMTLAVILFRQLVSETENSVPRICSDAFASLVIPTKETLLHLMQHEPRKSVRRQVAFALSAVGALLADGNRWPELLQTLFGALRSPEAAHRASALAVIGDLARMSGGMIQSHLSDIHDALFVTLSERSDDVRSAALTTFGYLIPLVLTTKGERKRYQKLLNVVLESVRAAAMAREDAGAAAGISAFITVADHDPSFLKPSAKAILSTMLELAAASEEDVDNSVRFVAVEVLLSIAENRAGMLKRLPDAVERLVQILVGWLCLSDDDDRNEAEWEATSQESDDDINGCVELACESIDRLSAALGAEALGPMLYTMLGGLLHSENWSERVGSLYGIECSVEGCADFVRTIVEQVLPQVVQQLEHPHPRVRYAACEALGELFNTLGPGLQEQYHEHLVPPLHRLLDDPHSARVRGNAAATLVSFCSGVSAATVNHYAERLLERLYVHLTAPNAPLHVREDTLTAVAAIAAASSTGFEKFYATFTPFLKQLLVSANEAEHSRLRGKAIEALTLMARAIGARRAAADLPAMLEYVLSALQAQLPDNDPQLEYLDTAATRLCRLYGADGFLPYLPRVLPRLIQKAVTKIKVDVYDIGDELDDDEEATGMNYYEQDGKVIGINTASLEEQASAWRFLTVYAEEMGAGFAEFVPEVFDAAVKLVREAYNASVKDAALGALPWLLSSVAKWCGANGASPLAAERATWLRKQLDSVLNVLDKAARDESDLQFCALMLESMHESIAFVGDGLGHGEFLSAARFKKLIALAEYIVNHFIEAQAEKERLIREDEDADELELEEMETMSRSTLVQIGEILNQTLRFHPTAFYAYFESLMPLVREWIEPNQPKAYRHFALCLLDDLFEHCQGTCTKYLDLFVSNVFAALDDPEPDMRQAAAFGIGPAAVSAGDAFVPFLPRALEALATVINHTDPTAIHEVLIVRDNAVSSFGRIVLHHAQNIDAPAMLAMWLAWLPTTDDTTEAKIVNRTLCGVVEHYGLAVFGAETAFDRLPHMLRVFAVALCSSDLMEDETRAQFRVILAQLHTQVPPEVLQSAVATLSEQHRAALSGDEH